jgi:hypothetical protein
MHNNETPYWYPKHGDRDIRDIKASLALREDEEEPPTRSELFEDKVCLLYRTTNMTYGEIAKAAHGTIRQVAIALMLNDYVRFKDLELTKEETLAISVGNSWM